MVVRHRYHNQAFIGSSYNYVFLLPGTFTKVLESYSRTIIVKHETFLRRTMDPPLIDVENERNVSLLKMLQSMKRIEDDPSKRFQTNDIDLSTVTPKYPNVVIVDQNSERFKAVGVADARKLGLPPFVRYIGNTFSDVLTQVTQFQILFPEAGGWTIILKEGLYIDPFLTTFAIDQRTREKSLVYPKIEVIGLKDTRLLFTTKRTAAKFKLCGDVSIQNIRIYDFEGKPAKENSSLLILYQGAKIRLTNVKIFAPGGSILCSHPASTVFIHDCSFIDAYRGFNSASAIGGRFILDDSLFSEVTIVAGFSSSRVSAKIQNCDFHNSGSISVVDGSRCNINSCRFWRDESNAVSYTTALFCFTGGTIDCIKSSFHGVAFVAVSWKSPSKVALYECAIAEADEVMLLRENASGSCEDCYISAKRVFRISQNVEGDVRYFQNNFWKTRNNTQAQPMVVKDAKSKMPLSDVQLLCDIEEEVPSR